MVVFANPWGRSKHDHVGHHEGDNTPSEDDRRGVLGNMVLEGPNDEEEEPSNAAGSATRVDTTDVLNEAGKEDAPPERSPLQSVCQICAESSALILRTFWKVLTSGQ